MEKERGITITNVEKEQAIADIAWEFFLQKTGLSFNSSFTEDDKKGITDVKEHGYYTDEATKIYERRLIKKQKSLLNKKYPVIEVPASGKRGWMGGAYVLCFVYSKHKGNFVLKGYIKEVQEFLKKNYTHYFYNMSLWYHGSNRDLWGFWKGNVGIFEPAKRRGDFKFMVRPYGGSITGEILSDEELQAKTFKFKRLPKRWIPEFDKF